MDPACATSIAATGLHSVGLFFDKVHSIMDTLDDIELDRDRSALIDNI